MVFGLFTNRKRDKLKAEPKPRWRTILEHSFPLFNRLTEEDRNELLGHVNVFLSEKHFEGCGGLEIDDEIRVTIAAQACLLLLNRAQDYFPGLQSVLVYPSSYFAPTEVMDDAGVIHAGDEHRLGEASHRGAIVLSWDDVRRDGREISD